MIISNLERNVQTIKGWYTSRRKSQKTGSGHRKNPDLIMFPFSANDIDYDLQLELDDFIDAIEREYGTHDSFFRRRIQEFTNYIPQTELVKYIRWMWMCRQTNEFVEKESRPDLLADPNVNEIAVVLNSRYVSINCLVYADGRCYVNSVCTNPYLAGGGYATVAYKRLENYLIEKHGITRLFLIPLTEKDGADSNATGYWKKIGYDWVKDKDELWKYTDYQVGDDDPEILPVGRDDRPEIYDDNGDIWSSTFMWKTARPWPNDQLRHVNSNFNEEVDFDFRRPGPTPIYKRYFQYDPKHETKMGFNNVRPDKIKLLEDSIKLANPLTPKPFSEPRVSRRKRAPDAEPIDDVPLLQSVSKSPKSLPTKPAKPPAKPAPQTFAPAKPPPLQPTFAPGKPPPLRYKTRSATRQMRGKGKLENETNIFDGGVTTSNYHDVERSKDYQYVGTYPPKIVDRF